MAGRQPDEILLQDGADDQRRASGRSHDTWRHGAGSTTASVPLEWYAGGASRSQLTKITADAFRQFGVPVWAEPSAKPPAGDLGRFYWFLPGVVAQSNDFANMHTAGDTPEMVSPSGLGGGDARLCQDPSTT